MWSQFQNDLFLALPGNHLKFNIGGWTSWFNFPSVLIVNYIRCAGSYSQKCSKRILESSLYLGLLVSPLPAWKCCIKEGRCNCAGWSQRCGITFMISALQRHWKVTEKRGNFLAINLWESLATLIWFKTWTSWPQSSQKVLVSCLFQGSPELFCLEWMHLRKQIALSIAWVHVWTQWVKPLTCKYEKYKLGLLVSPDRLWHHWGEWLRDWH